MQLVEQVDVCELCDKCSSSPSAIYARCSRWHRQRGQLYVPNAPSILWSCVPLLILLAPRLSVNPPILFPTSGSFASQLPSLHPPSLPTQNTQPRAHPGHDTQTRRPTDNTHPHMRVDPLPLTPTDQVPACPPAAASPWPCPPRSVCCIVDQEVLGWV